MEAHLLQTPLKSARKRNLFPKSPNAESSDGSLGHMSPLPSSPDRYSSAPHTPQNWMLETPPRVMSDHSPVQGRGFDSLRFRLSHTKSTFLARRSPRWQTADTDKTILCGETIPETPLKSPSTHCSRTPFTYLEKSVTTLTPKHKISKYVVEESPDTESLGVMTPSKSSNKKGGQSLTTISPSTFYKSAPARTAPARILFPDLGSNFRIKSFFGGVTRDNGEIVRKVGAMKPKLSQSVSSLYSDKSLKSHARPINRSNTAKYKRAPGEINAGVHHNIRRPKPKYKLSPRISKVPKVTPDDRIVTSLDSSGLLPDALVLPQKNISDEPTSENSSMQIEESKISETPSKSFTEARTKGTKRKVPEPPTPPPDPSKKFFKTNRTIGINKKKTVTVDANISFLPHQPYKGSLYLASLLWPLPSIQQPFCSDADSIGQNKFSLFGFLVPPIPTASSSTLPPAHFTTNIRASKERSKHKACFRGLPGIDAYKLEVSNGKFSLEKPSVKPKFCKNLNYQLNNAEVTIALFEPLDIEERQTLQVKSSVNQILEQLDKALLPVSNDPHSLPVVSLCRLPQEMESMVKDNQTIYKGDVDRIIALTTPKKGTTKCQGVFPSGAKTDTHHDLTITSSLSPLMVKHPNNTNKSLGNDGEPLLDEEAKSPEKENCQKYYPLFNSPARQEKKLTDSKRLWWPLGNDQYQIDAGQKKFGATQCSDCGIVYQQGDPDDEMSHLNFHNSSKSLKFAGWKQERIVGEYGNGRVVLITPNDSKVWCKKAADVVEVADKDLGYAESGLNISNSKVYLYVEDRQVVGCLVAEHVTKAHRLLDFTGLDTCSKETYPVKCGISRIWTLINCRRRGIATRLVNCMSSVYCDSDTWNNVVRPCMTRGLSFCFRGNFIYGYILSSGEFAFSVPTVSGKAFASKYMGTPHFLVYT
uniref:N-acetyltransferase ESCO acetyl-transferase domain-containing protein n=1 Tax=Timema tahoe TaxID=61484 RepID=A0A7R9FLR1_9NEOP|nr:unnamed protein product [Timema tahoe]